MMRKEGEKEGECCASLFRATFNDESDGAYWGCFLGSEELFVLFSLLTFLLSLRLTEVLFPGQSGSLKLIIAFCLCIYKIWGFKDF